MLAHSHQPREPQRFHRCILIGPPAQRSRGKTHVPVRSPDIAWPVPGGMRREHRGGCPRGCVIRCSRPAGQEHRYGSVKRYDTFTACCRGTGHGKAYHVGQAAGTGNPAGLRSASTARSLPGTDRARNGTTAGGFSAHPSYKRPDLPAASRVVPGVKPLGNNWLRGIGVRAAYGWNPLPPSRQCPANPGYDHVADTQSGSPWHRLGFDTHFQP